MKLWLEKDVLINWTYNNHYIFSHFIPLFPIFLLLPFHYYFGAFYAKNYIFQADTYGNEYVDADEFVKTRLGLELSLDLDKIDSSNFSVNPFYTGPKKQAQHKVGAFDFLPKSYDAREHYKKCKSIGLIRDQSNCGSCWVHYYFFGDFNRIKIIHPMKKNLNRLFQLRPSSVIEYAYIAMQNSISPYLVNSLLLATKTITAVEVVIWTKYGNFIKSTDALPVESSNPMK